MAVVVRHSHVQPGSQLGDVGHLHSAGRGMAGGQGRRENYSGAGSKAGCSAHQIRDLLEALPHWGRVLEAFSGGRHSCVRDPNWTPNRSHSPYDCANLQRIQGATIFSPVLGHFLRVQRFLGLARCLRLIERQESQRGERYVHIVHSRLEMVWLTPHPRVAELSDPTHPECARAVEVLWVPKGSDFYGLNDRHAMMSRSIGDTYLGQWQRILDGRVMSDNADLRQGRCCSSSASPERHLEALMSLTRTRVCRYRVATFLGCCSEWMRSRCFRTECHVRPLPVEAWPWLAPPFVNASAVAGKDAKELADAIRLALRMRMPHANRSRPLRAEFALDQDVDYMN